MNREVFFASVRQRASGVFGTSLSQKQVAGVEAILDEAQKRGTNRFHLAAILAEVYHETGGQMEPVKETVYASSKDRNPSDATVIARLNAAFAKGQLKWVKTPYWRTGWFGRGLIQLTHEANYLKFGVTKEQALDLRTSVRIVFDGMERGLFTGKKLSDYDYLINGQSGLPAFRFKESRAIVNGDVSGNGPKIETYGKAFLSALAAAGYDPSTKPTVAPPEPVPATPAPAKLEKGPVPTGNWLAAVVKAIAAIFGART